MRDDLRSQGPDTGTVFVRAQPAKDEGVAAGVLHRLEPGRPRRDLRPKTTDFNNKHHSTVMYSVEKIDEKMQNDPQFARVLEGLMKQFR